MGIVGMPNVGKSTLFNTLSKMGIPAENFPFCTIDPNNVSCSSGGSNRRCGNSAAVRQRGSSAAAWRHGTHMTSSSTAPGAAHSSAL